MSARGGRKGKNDKDVLKTTLYNDTSERTLNKGGYKGSSKSAHYCTYSPYLYPTRNRLCK